MKRYGCSIPEVQYLYMSEIPEKHIRKNKGVEEMMQKTIEDAEEKGSSKCLVLKEHASTNWGAGWENPTQEPAEPGSSSVLDLRTNTSMR